jgi:hypothetical protein
MLCLQRYLLCVAFLLLGALPAAAQQPWTQYLDQNHCAMTRGGWMAIAQSNPGFGWAYAPGAANSNTFAEAAAWLDVLRLSLAMGPGNNSPNFRDYCCQVDIWENAQTGQVSITLDGQPAGFGFALSALNQPLMCCEDAAFAIGADPLGCTGVPLMSVPGAVVVVTPTGGPISVTGPVTIPSNPPVQVASMQQPQQPAGTYLGCFNDPNNPFDLDGYLERSAANTPQSCVATCYNQGFPFAGVQYGQSCLCGNSYGNFGTSDRCNMPCTGDPSQVCGGYNSNSVYATGL